MRASAHAAARLMAAFLVLLGVAVLIRTATASGAENDGGLRVGYLIGPAFIVAGIARLKLSQHRRTQVVPRESDAGGDD